MYIELEIHEELRQNFVFGFINNNIKKYRNRLVHRKKVWITLGESLIFVQNLGGFLYCETKQTDRDKRIKEKCLSL